MPGLYIHIPFCEKKCVYCDFYSIESFRQYDDVLDGIHDEIVMRAEKRQYDESFDSVFFGGGTPSLLDDVQLGGILDAVFRNYRVDEDAEISVECNPGTITLEKLRGYSNAGVNRLSIGVQSFHEDDLRMLTRIHSAHDAVEAIRLAHAAGYDNVNVDLMFSLPGQTTERWQYNLDRVRELGSTHISCYSLTVEQGTPLERMVQRGMISMPPGESDAVLFELTMATLSSWGYKHYEVSNYALPGYECKHNLGYWRHEDYLGIGPSAYSACAERRWWNYADVRRYVDAITEGRLPEDDGELLTLEMRRSEYIYLRLRSEGIDVCDFEQRFGTDLRKDNSAFIDRCLSEGYMLVNNGVISLSRKGMLVCDEICAELS